MAHPLAARFREFAESECKDSSALYYALSHAIAEDEAVLDVAAESRPGQPVPNMLFGAVHYLLLNGGGRERLAEFYSSFGRSARAPFEAWPDFREFVLEHRAEIVALLKSRLVQTNEARRSAFLFPALALAAERFGARPVALIEIGTSAGLNLIWDKYRYDYGDGMMRGDLISPVLVSSSFRGALRPDWSLAAPPVSHRIGLDLNIIDTRFPDQADWLRALIWPEHHERRSLLELAMKRRNEVALDLREGDGFAMLGELEREIPRESVMCVYHTHVANQIPVQAQERFLASIEEIGLRRGIIHLCNNIKPNLHLTVYRRGKCAVDTPIANTDGHARWIEWLHAPEATADA